MSEFMIEVNGGATVRLPTGGKYCPQDMLVTGKGGDTEAAYNEGYEMGAKEGAEVGYAKGEQEGYEKGYADGEVAGEKNGALQYSFSVRFADLNLFGKKEIEIYVPNIVSAAQMFSTPVANTTVEHITVIGGTEPTLTNANQMFNMNWIGGPLKHITLDIDFSKVTNTYLMFSNHSATVTIDGKPLNFSSATETVTFYHLSRLEYVRFAPGTMEQSLNMSACAKLTYDSIQSVIDGLKDLTGASAKTLTFHANVGAKLTQAQKDAISAKNWTLVY